MSKIVKVLVVDDSALVRQTMIEILSTDDGIQVMGGATDPYAALQRMEQEIPDVLLLDVEMPRMDGITFLRKIMTQNPLPVVICSTLTEAGAETTFKALEYGAVEIIQKPKLGTKKFLEESKIRICDAVKAAAKAKLRPFVGVTQPTKKITADAVIAPPTSRAMVKTTEKVVVVGASTGGTEALRILLEAMPLDCPPMAVVQHMPENFTAAFADRLNSMCQITVKEARDNDTMLRGQCLIAPGNRHMLLKRSGARYHVEIKDGPLVSRHRPSVDVLFRSAARYAGANAVGVIMTGMGDDGAKGMKEMHDAGAGTIAQDEASCVVFGMPQEAIKLGAADKVVSLERIPATMIRMCE